MEVLDFIEEDGYANEELFDCDYSSVDDVINQVLVFTGATERDTENGKRTLIAFQWTMALEVLSGLTAES